MTDTAESSSTAAAHSLEQYGTRYALAAAMLWSLAMGALLAWNIHQERHGTLKLANAEVRAHYAIDNSIRWVTSHGGVSESR